MFLRITTGQGIGRLIASLESYIDEQGDIMSPSSVSGMPTSEKVKAVNNVMFGIAQPILQENIDRLILESHGEKGLSFLKVEGEEWFSAFYDNPGEAWKEDPERWEKFLNSKGNMDYSYNARVNKYGAIDRVVKELTVNKHTRRAYLPIFAITDTLSITLKRMIPCIIGYQFSINRYDTLDVSVIMRSCDITNCLRNDIWLAHNLLKHVSNNVEGTTTGDITFYIANLHQYSVITSK